MMVLMDKDVDQYINLDMTEIDMLTFEERTDLPAVIKSECQEKSKFRLQLAQNVSIFRLDYMLRVMRKIFNGKYSIADPNGFKAKLKQLKKNERIQEKLKRSLSASSFGTESQFSKSKTNQSSLGGTQFSATDAASSVDGGEERGHSDRGDDDDEGMVQDKQKKNLVMNSLVELFDEVQQNI